MPDATTTTDAAKADPTKGHTPTPWAFPINAGWNIMAGKAVVCRLRFSDDMRDIERDDVSRIDAQAEASGHLIVRAVNNHFALKRELQAAHKIIQNALNLMTPEQKWLWGERNAADLVDGEGITRANERLAVIELVRGEA